MKTVINFSIEKSQKCCEIELSKEAMEECAKRYLAMRLQAYFRIAEPVEYGTMEVCGFMTKFKEIQFHPAREIDSLAK